MAFDPVPYFTGVDGVKHSAEVVRQSLYYATGGAEGVGGPSDLKVLPLNSPGQGVRILTGGGLMLNRYAGGSGQSYSGRNNTETEVVVPSTSSGGGRSDMVVMRVLDPQYEGQPPADPNNFQYTRAEVIQGVPADVQHFSTLGLNYPAIALARIDQPLSNSAVQLGHVVDLRRLAVNREHTEKRLFFPNANKLMSKTAYGPWPFSGVITNVFVPEWATVVDIVATVNGIEFTGSAAVKNTGGVRTVFGTNAAQNGIVSGFGGSRQSISIIGNHPVTLAQRGTLQSIGLEGYQTVGTGGIEADYQSGIAVEWTFKQGIS